MIIRPETPADIAAIESVAISAFRNAPHADGTEQFIVNALRKANALTLSLVAEIDGVIVGHVAISPVAISDGSPNWYGVGPISVLPDRQRRGIGSALMDQSLSQLREHGAFGCVVLGDPEYYTRFGFKSVPGLILPGVPLDVFMALAFGSSIPQGLISYHESFHAKS